MDPVTLALLISAIGAVASIGTSLVGNIGQRKRDEAADARRIAGEKELMDYELQQTQNTNTVATQKGHAASAGYSPALMYGSGGMTDLFKGSSGSAQGTSSPLNLPGMFDKVPLNNVYEAVVTKRDQDMRQQQIASNILLNQKQGLLADAKTMEQLRQTGVSKHMEKTIMDQMNADLALTRSRSANLDAMTNRSEALLPLDLQAQGLINEETAAKISKVHSDITRNSWEMRQIQADIKRINAVTSLTNAEIGLTDAQKQGVIESTKKSAIGRLMEEFGLNNRDLPAALRKGSWIHNKAYETQMRGAYLELLQLGFSEHEAINAVLYYVLPSKDVTPSLINSVSRVISTGMKNAK